MNGDQDKTAAVLLYDGCTIAEVIEPATRLHNNGVDVSWASAGERCVRDQSGLEVTATTSLKELAASSLSVLVIPGGDPRSVLGDDDIRSFVRSVADGGTVAGICGGSLVLADAGLLVGRSATHNYRAPWSPPEIEAFVADLFDGAIIEPDRSVGLVHDGPTITALPNATAEFSIAVCAAAGVYDQPMADQLVRHLQGDFVPELFSLDER